MMGCLYRLFVISILNDESKIKYNDRWASVLKIRLPVFEHMKNYK